MWFLPESHLPGPEKTYGGKLVWRMSDGRQEQLEDIVWRSAIVSEIIFWTVSGDYDTEFEPDTEKYVLFKTNGFLYEAVKQGAFARYFDQKKLGIYLMKKLYFFAGEICSCLLLDYAWMLQ